jgi:predicted acyltransferase
LVAWFVIVTARPGGTPNLRAVTWAIVIILGSYFALLQWVPVPGYGAPRFDPVGSWPAVIDRAVFTPDHMFPWWPVDGRVVFDPEGILSTWPACTNILFGVLVGAWHLAGARRPVAAPVVVGVVLMAVAVALHPVCPIIKNLWTPTFVLFTCGFGLASLGVLTAAESSPVATTLLRPAAIFGSNALLAYMISFLMAPLLDAALFPERYHSIRHGTFVVFNAFAAPNLASLFAGLVCTAVILAPLILCHRRRWFLRL